MRRFVLIFCATFLSCCSSPKGWLIDYDAHLDIPKISKLNFLITDPDLITPQEFKTRTKAHFIAYLSVGEIHESRSYWPLFNNSQAVIEKNPEWEGAYRLDIRNKAWQEYIRDHLIPRFMTDGYTGVFLDTLDTAIYAQELDSKKYAGSEVALVSFIEDLHQKYPTLAIYTNNAFALLDKMAPSITGVVAEDVLTRYNFSKNTYESTLESESKEKIKVLKHLKERFNKPIYVILYDTNLNSGVIKNSIATLKSLGFHYFVSDVHFAGENLIED